jgi:hypothetical protein
MPRWQGLASCSALLALLILPVVAAAAVTAGQQEVNAVAGLGQSQLLTDSALGDLRGRGTVTLSWFDNGLTGVGTQVNQISQGSATQSSTINGYTLSGPGTLSHKCSQVLEYSFRVVLVNANTRC